MPYLYRSFSAKEPIISGSFAKNVLQHKASYGSSPPCSQISGNRFNSRVVQMYKKPCVQDQMHPHKC